MSGVSAKLARKPDTPCSLGARDGPLVEMKSQPKISRDAQPARAANAAPAGSHVRTDPLRDSELGHHYALPDAITRFEEFDGTLGFDFPPGLREISVGADERESSVVVAERGLSRKHADLTRRGASVRVVDLASTNGTYYKNHKVAERTIAPGDVIRFGKATFVAMNDEMRSYRPTFLAVLGRGHMPSPDSYLVDYALGTSHLLLTGTADRGQARLVKATHGVSVLRQKTPVELHSVPSDHAGQRAVIDAATRGTLVLSLFSQHAPLDRGFCSKLFSASYGIRVIALASTPEEAKRILGADAMAHLRVVEIRRLAERKAHIHQVLDLLLTEMSSSIRCADLKLANYTALAEYDWPENFDEIAWAASAFHALSRMGTRPAATALGLPKSTFGDRLKKMGLTTPLFTDEKLHY